MIVHESDGVTLVGGAPLNPEDFNIALRHAPNVVAADGGAAPIWAAGLTPIAVIGDMDSLSGMARAAYADRLHVVDEQDTTDFEKCLTRIEAPLVLALGFTGGRIDHTMSVFNTMARYRDRPVVLLGSDDVCAIIPAAGFDLTLPAGCRLSLLPIGQAEVSTTGLKWDLDQAALAPNGMISPSNEVAGPLVILRADGPVMLVLPRSGLEPLLAAVKATVREE